MCFPSTQVRFIISEVSHKWGPWVGTLMHLTSPLSVVCWGLFVHIYWGVVIHCVDVKQFAFTSTYSWTFELFVALVNKPAVSVHGQLYVDVCSHFS